MKGMALVLAAAVSLSGQPYAEQPKPARTLAEMEPVIQKIETWEFNQSRDPLYEFSEFLQSALSSPARLREIESRLLKLLKPGTTQAGKDFVCRQLSVIGTAASVPVLSKMLLDPATSDMARYALDGIPDGASADALLAALPKVSGKAKIGVIHSLGYGRNRKSVPALSALLLSQDAGIRQASAVALAAIGDGPALEALAAARTRLTGEERVVVSEAYLRCAEKVAAGGDRAAALQAYRRMLASGETEMIRVTALAGLAATGGKEAVPDLEKELASGSRKTQLAAIRLLKEIPGAEITNLLAKSAAALPAAARVQVVAALGDRGDPNGRQAVVSALGSESKEVRTAALQALGNLGDGHSVILLADLAAKAEDVEQTAARQSLARIRGKEAEAAIVRSINSAAGRSRVELIRAAGERGLQAAGNSLIAAAGDPERQVRREAMRALRAVAEPSQERALLELLMKAPDDAERRECARALSAALRRSGQPAISGTISAFRSAESVPVRATLLEVMGEVSDESALSLLRNSLNDSQPEIARAAILALSEWGSAVPMADLLKVAKTSANPSHQILALRGYINLVSASSGRSLNETVTLLSEAMAVASQPEEKRAILSLLQGHPTREGLKLAEEAAKDPAVEREAKSAAGRIRLALGAER